VAYPIDEFFVRVMCEPSYRCAPTAVAISHIGAVGTDEVDGAVYRCCMADGVGRLLRDRYELLERVGRGGQGEVWRARDRQHDRDVAIKMRPTGQQGGRDALLGEARILLGLTPHRGVTNVRDDFFEGDHYCLVMDWIDGRSLATIRADDGTPGLPLDRVIDVLEQVADALDHLHSHAPAVVHQDVKPHNIVVTDDGRAVLVDFGVARGRQAYHNAGGTASYVAPEVVAGDVPSPASDVYALGVTVWELLTGERPEPGGTLPVGLDDRVGDVLFAALSMDPMRRPPSAGALIARLALAAGLQREVFVGRAAELADLRSVLSDAIGGHGGVVLVAGEPGIGKSAFVRQAAAFARSQGSRVVWGRTSEVPGAPPFWPWMQALRALDHEIDVPTSGASIDRFEFIDLATEILGAVAEQEPLTVVLDDLHWADLGSILLLQHLAGVCRDRRIVVVGTHRPINPEEQPDVAGALAGVAAAARTITLNGLDPDEVEMFVDASFRTGAQPAVARGIHAATAGNPFFVREVTSLLVAEDRLADATSGSIGTPRAVRDVVQHRVRSLPTDTIELLEVASVLGTESSYSLMSSILGTDRADTMRRVAPAMSRGVLQEVEDDLDGVRFSHSIARDAIYGAVPAHRRSELHLRAGQAIEGVYASALDDHLADLAHHFVRASDVGDPQRAIDYALRAGRQAYAAKAFEDAHIHFRSALDVADAAHYDTPQRIDMVLDVAKTFAQTGRFDESIEAFELAGQIAKRHGDAERLCTVAAYYTTTVVADIPDLGVIRLCEEAIEAIADGDHVDLPIVLSSLGALLGQLGRDDEARALIAKAVAICDARGPSDVDAWVRANQLYTCPPDDPAEELAIIDGVIAFARANGDETVMMNFHATRVACLAVSGDMPGARETLADLERYIETRKGWRIPQLWPSLIRSGIGLIEGRFAEATEHGRIASQLIDYTHRPIPKIVELAVALGRGDHDRARALVGPVIVAPSLFTSTRCFLAAAAAELDDRTAVRDQIDRIGDPHTIARAGNWLANMCQLAQASVALQDEMLAASVYEMIVPFHDRFAVWGAVPVGPVSRFLGLLASLLGRPVDAVRHLEDALALSRSMGARPSEALVLLDQATVLVDGEPTVAREKAATAITIARELGMAPVVERGEALIRAARETV
jgi:eukaryotic-like serine/threonine-protein kinase